jgi:hypothetical protein
MLLSAVGSLPGVVFGRAGRERGTEAGDCKRERGGMAEERAAVAPGAKLVRGSGRF